LQFRRCVWAMLLRRATLAGGYVCGAAFAESA
jgi:hypothetical protein